MIRKTLVVFAIALAIAISLAPAFAATGTSTTTNNTTTNSTSTTTSTTSTTSTTGSGVLVNLAHYYTITQYGFGILNDTITFHNQGTSTQQAPTVQLGIPSAPPTLASDVVLSSQQYTLSSSSGVNGTTLYTIAPTGSAASLSAGANSTVSLKAYFSNTLNFTSQSNTANATVLVILSPSLNSQVGSFQSAIALPSGGSFASPPPGFVSAGNTTSSYTKTSTNVTPVALAMRLQFSDADQGSFTPIALPSLVRTIVPFANGNPQIQDRITLTNVASYTLNLLRLDLLDSNLSKVLMLPDTQPPLLNPQTISVAGGILTFTQSPIAANIPAHSNVTFTISYSVPSSDVKTSGNQVKVTIPYTPTVPGVVENYTVVFSTIKGVVPQNSALVSLKNVSPLKTGTIEFSYTVNLGWAADAVVPAASLIFGVVFIGLAFQQKHPSEEEEEEVKEAKTIKITDVIADFEEKFALANQRFEELRSRPRGSVTRSELEKIRQEMDSLRTRALQSLSLARQNAGAGKQYDLLLQVGEAERAEDRAEKDLLNLYAQYHGQRMSEETFKRLLPNYRRRVESSINRLSDLLNTAQKEGK